MRTTDILGIPSLPNRAFRADPRGHIKPQGGGKGGAPDTPDYEALAREQAKAQRDLLNQQTQANRVNQVTPWGSLTWSNNRQFNQAGYDAAMKAYNEGQGGRWETRPTSYGYTGDNGTDYKRVWVPGGEGGSGMKAPDPNDFYTGGNQWTQTQTLSPEVQALFDRAMSGLNSDPSASGLRAYDPNLDTNNATELIMKRLNPELDRQDEALRARLANQGIAEGSEAWNRAIGNFGQQRNDAATQAALQGIGLGMQQQGQTFQNNAYLRGLPLNELNAVLSGGQLNFPSYSQAGVAQAPDLLGAATQQYNADLNAYNASQAQQGGLFGGLGALAGAGIGYGLGGLPGLGVGSQLGAGIGGLFSDRRLKTDIKRIGTADNGLSIYSYRYVFGGPQQIGYMADEVEGMFPAAVSERDGYKVVDYSKVH